MYWHCFKFTKSISGFYYFHFLLKLKLARKLWCAQNQLPIPNTACITPCSSFHRQPIVLSILLASYAWVRGRNNFIFILLPTSPWYKGLFQYDSIKYYAYPSALNRWKLRSNRLKVFCKTTFLKFSRKIHRKTPVLGSYINRVAGKRCVTIRNWTPARVWYYKYSEKFQDRNFTDFSYISFKEILLRTPDYHAPIIKKMLRPNENPFVSKALREVIMMWSRMKNLYLKNKTDLKLKTIKNKEISVQTFFVRLKRSAFQNLR